MIVGDNKEVTDIYYQNDDIVKAYLGENLVFEKNSDGFLHFIGSFSDSAAEADRYVWINGTQYFLDKEFDFKLNAVWKYGESLIDGNDTTFSRFSSKLKTITGGECYGMTSLNQVFLGSPSSATSLNLSEWDVSEVESMNGMFIMGFSLSYLNLEGWVPKKLKELNTVFAYCNKLTSLDLAGWETGAVTSMRMLFNACTGLRTLNISGWNFNSVENLENMFFNCSALSTVTGPVYNIPVDLSLNKSPLSVDSAMVFINGLKSGVSGKNLTLKASVYSSLSAAQIAVGTAKGWTIVSA